MTTSSYDRDHGADSYVPQAFYMLCDQLSLSALREMRDLLGGFVPADDRDEMMCETATDVLARRSAPGMLPRPAPRT